MARIPSRGAFSNNFLPSALAGCRKTLPVLAEKPVAEDKVVCAATRIRSNLFLLGLWERLPRLGLPFRA